MPGIDTNLTGQARFRRDWRQRLILQVEEQLPVDRAMGQPRTFWRDAAEHDLWKLRYVRETKKLEPLL